jgi:mannose-6-phosphate isomerase-like protein (cupin superfamily)
LRRIIQCMLCTDAPTQPRVATYGAALTFETVEAFEDRPAPVRMRPWEDTLLRVLDGILRLTTDGEECRMSLGDEAILPAGTPYQLAGVDGPAKVVLGYR